MKLVCRPILFVLALTACSEFQSHGVTPYAPVVSKGYGVDYWLAELHNTRNMTPEEIRNTVTAWEQELQDDPSAGNHIKLALLLTVGDVSVRDLQRAGDLLDDIAPLPDNTSDRELIDILRQIIDERVEADIAINKLRKQERQQGERIRELEQQQRALTDIEQNIQQRDIQPDFENGGE